MIPRMEQKRKLQLAKIKGKEQIVALPSGSLPPHPLASRVAIGLRILPTSNSRTCGCNEGFHDMVKKWWQERPCYLNKEVFGKLNSVIKKAMYDLLPTDSTISKGKGNLLETKIACLWLKRRDRNTKYFQRIANSPQ
ncbi:hypothetical protein H5410_023270 [Solanum commersonii]|uniref:Uncharacterized protein n=1 Tax=Solanum commersonii TaxID=4109 RepID=A0A9J5ZHT4_SOLCO|nr:hypothetical protein H5410_023270 [Solanum commersonii]